MGSQGSDWWSRGSGWWSPQGSGWVSGGSGWGPGALVGDSGGLPMGPELCLGSRGSGWGSQGFVWESGGLSGVPRLCLGVRRSVCGPRALSGVPGAAAAERGEPGCPRSRPREAPVPVPSPTRLFPAPGLQNTFHPPSPPPPAPSPPRSAASDSAPPHPRAPAAPPGPAGPRCPEPPRALPGGSGAAARPYRERGADRARHFLFPRKGPAAGRDRPARPPHRGYRGNRDRLPRLERPGPARPLPPTGATRTAAPRDAPFPGHTGPGANRPPHRRKRGIPQRRDRGNVMETPGRYHWDPPWLPRGAGGWE